jgi:peptidoglycan/LPS O-acetylase OafA/YrhL
VAAAALGFEPVRKAFLWHVTYLTNFYIVKINAHPLSATHLWTLAVEEQFYLVWPFIIFFLPRRLLPVMLIGLIASSLIFRLLWRYAGLGDFGAWYLPPGSFDALAMGAFLALYKRKAQLIKVIGVIGFSIWLATTVSARVSGGSWLISGAGVASTAAAMVFTLTIARAAEGIGGIAGKILNNTWLQYIGAISYGIYVLHSFVFDALGNTGVRFRWHVLLSLGICILLASLSWHFFERPIARAGRRRIVTALASSSAVSPALMGHDVERV